MTLTNDQARKIAEIAGWDYGEYSESYSGKMPDGMYWHMICDGVVTWEGLGDLLRVCEERGIAVRLYMDTGQILIERFNHQARSVGHKFSTFHTHNDIPTALALAMLEALEV